MHMLLSNRLVFGALATALFTSVSLAAVPFSDTFNDLTNWTTAQTGVTAPTTSSGSLVLGLGTTDTFSTITNGGAGAYNFITAGTGNALTITVTDFQSSSDTGTTNVTSFGFTNRADQTLFGANGIFVSLTAGTRLRVNAYRNGTNNSLLDTDITAEVESLSQAYNSITFTVSDTAWSLVTVNSSGVELLSVSGAILETQFNPSAWSNSFLAVQLTQLNTRTAQTTIGAISVTEASAVPEPNTYTLLLGAGVLGVVAIRRRR